MKIGILTYHHVINDGAVLQTLGHVYTLNELFPNAIVEVIDYRHKSIEKIEKREAFKSLLKLKKDGFSKIKKYYSFKKFVSELLPLSKDYLTSDNLKEATDFINKQNYDFVIVGSDEVWKILDRKFARHFPNIYWLPKEIKAKRIASAASANGSKPSLLEDSKTREEIKDIVSGFHKIATRDQYTYNLIKGIDENIDVYQVPDPTFGVEWEAKGVKEKLVKVGVDFKRKRFAMNLSSNSLEFDKASEQIFNYAQKNNIQLVGIGQYNKYCEINFSDVLNSLEWATCYQYFDFCVTDRFHSTIFSVKNNIPFLVIESTKKYPTAHKGKIFDLLTKMDIIEHHQFYAKEVDFENKIIKLLSDFEASALKEKVNEMKSQFRNHLMKAIES
ncbi:polysaccharide pyruvyl transferase family protein [Flavobacterium sp.]|uniref:polysaccharide pyruvyl transferase family protein n=1 Tax=Flavobacterium sp. TaxID=239 RepID=UPI0026377239|nr:polysaccharide pyruvyl transferase family protein [Flavobacterium sp.]MDD2985957.1 polysaccharide pyruvyl transferase family protein [Flavobacterium sp.]